ncbi:MAG: GntR family transcriptional regulator [Betaproteobacteria bacterium]|nr:MAG: GntR family transcriptional regulator [Betaproteobacteria bacterium]
MALSNLQLRPRAGAPSPREPASAGYEPIEPLTRSLPEQIAARLAQRILAGAYAPGERIREEALAAEFGVSRGPAREALRLLEKDGLITILARRGAMVTKLSVDEVREIFEIRAVLNGLRDRLVAESEAREQVLPLLEAEVATLAQCARAPERGEAYVETVLQINRLLNRATPNRRLSSYLTSLEQQTARYSRLGLSTPERRRQSVQRWQRLVKAIRTGDGAEAERIARERVLESRDAAIRLLAAREETGDEKNRGQTPL